MSNITLVNSEFCSMGRWIVSAAANKLDYDFWDQARFVKEFSDSKNLIKQSELITEKLMRDSSDASLKNDLSNIQKKIMNKILDTTNSDNIVIHDFGIEKYIPKDNTVRKVFIYNNDVNAKCSRVTYEPRYKNLNDDSLRRSKLVYEDSLRRMYFRIGNNDDKWNDVNHYDLCLNTANLPKSQCSDILVSFLGKPSMSEDEFQKVVIGRYGDVERD